MSPRLQSIALSPLDQIWLCVTGSMKFSPPPEEVEANRPRPKGRTAGTKNAVDMGAVKALAIRVVDGEVTGDSYNAIGAAHGVNGDSLKAAVCRERHQRAKVKQEDAA